MFIYKNEGEFCYRGKPCFSFTHIDGGRFVTGVFTPGSEQCEPSGCNRTPVTKPPPPIYVCLLKKILDAEREITHDRNHNNINIFCMRKIKRSTFTARDLKLNFRNKKSPDASSISVWQNYSSCSNVYLKTQGAINGFNFRCED